jgi:hypothetical protein
MSSAHEITIALSKNSAHNASIIAAPRRFRFGFRLPRRSLAKAGCSDFEFSIDS